VLHKRSSESSILAAAAATLVQRKRDVAVVAAKVWAVLRESNEGGSKAAAEVCNSCMTTEMLCRATKLQ
jgi:hypothetical protein